MPDAGFIRGTAAQLVARLFFLISTIVLHKVAANILSPEQYATLGFLLIISLIFRLFLIGGVNQTVSHFLASTPDNQGAVLKSSFKLQLILTLIIVVLFIASVPVLQYLFEEKALNVCLLPLALTIGLMSLYGFYTAVLNGLHLLSRQAGVSMIYDFLRALGPIAGLLLFNNKLFGFFSGLAFSMGLSALIVAFRVPRIAPAKEHFPLKILIKFAIPLVCITLLNTLFIHLDYLTVKKLFGSTEASAFYYSASNLAKVPYQIYIGFAFAILPFFSKLFLMNDHMKARTCFISILKFIFLASGFAFVITFYKGEYFMALVYNESYRPAAALLPRLILSYTFAAITILVNTTAIAAKKKGLVFRMNLFMVCLGAVLCYLFTRFIGYEATPFAIMITAMIALPLALYKIFDNMQKLFTPILYYFLILSLLLWVLHLFRSLNVYLFCFVAAFLYISIFSVFRIIRKDDIRFLWENLLRKKA